MAVGLLKEKRSSLVVWRQAGTERGLRPGMQTVWQGNQRLPVTFSAAGGSKALFKGLVNAALAAEVSTAPEPSNSSPL